MTRDVELLATPDPATTPWVPLWDLNGAVDLNYRGAYVAATSYIDGDIVVYQGATYICVRPTTNPPAAWLPPLTPASYGTTLPASPRDGQEAILVDSVSNPTYQWRFRYNAQSSSAYKWECIGGVPWYGNVVATESTSSSTLTDLATVGPQINLPRAGEYLFRHGARLDSTGGAGGWIEGYICSNGIAVSDTQVTMGGATGLTVGAYVSRDNKLSNWNANDNVRVRWSTSGTSWSVLRRFLEVLPVRVA